MLVYQREDHKNYPGIIRSPQSSTSAAPSLPAAAQRGLASGLVASQVSVQLVPDGIRWADWGGLLGGNEINL